MDATLYRAPSAGTVIRTRTGYTAFIPAPLPPAIRFDADSILALTEADVALDAISQLAGKLPEPRLLIAPYLRREAVHSSRIDGTRAGLSDVLLEEAGASPEHDVADVRAVRNYVRALEYGIRRLPEGPSSLRLILEIHARLLEGIPGGQATAGEFRRSQNWIGPPGSDPRTAPYVPPPPQEMMSALGDWERFLQQRDSMPDLLQCALMHEQFETIHPFLHGNGRVGRLLISLFLIERGRLSAPLLCPSTYIEAHRQEYYDHLQRVRTDGDWESWIRYFLRGVAETAHTAVQQAHQLLDLRERFRAPLRHKPRALVLVDQLFINPYVTVGRAARLLQTSRDTASELIRLLEERAILEETTGRTWGRLYLARSILDVLEMGAQNVPHSQTPSPSKV